MFMDETVISIIFRLLNFGVIVGLAAYLIKTKVIGAVAQKISEKKYAQAALEKQHQDLIQQQHNFVKLQEQQEKLRKELLAKVRCWQAVNAQKVTVQQQELIQRKHYMAQALTQRREAIINRHVMRTVMPQVLDQVAGDLQKYFATSKNSTQAMDHIVDMLRKG